MSYVSFELYRDDDVCVEWYRCGRPTNTLFITFTPAPWRDLDGMGFGGKYLLDKGFDVLAIKSCWAHYWRTFGHDDLPERLSNLVDGFYEKRIGYGSSMGGLGVHIFRKRLNLTACFALSPRFVDLPQTQTKRPGARIHDINPLGEDSCKTYIIYDPKDIVDSLFVNRISPHGESNSLIYKMPYMGHPVGYSLNELSVLDDLVMCVVREDDDEFVERCEFAFQNRRRSSYYLATVGAAQLKRKRVACAISCADRALMVNPANKQALILRFDALIASGDRAAVVKMYTELASVRPKLTIIETLMRTRMPAIERRYGVDWLVQRSDVVTSTKYDEVVSRYEKEKNGKKFVYINHGCRRLIVSLTTHNNGYKYQSLVSLADVGYDTLFITNPDNSYYLEGDLGASYMNLLNEFIHDYGPENVIFFGSSMAGYAALRFAIKYSAAAIVCNPQIDFEITEKLCWPGLLASIKKILHRENIQDIVPGGPVYVRYAVGEYPMDKENMRIFQKYAIAQNGVVAVDYDYHDNPAHTFLFTDFKKFMNLVDLSMTRRKCM